MVIGPWGDILDELPEGEGVVMAEIEPKRLDSVRTQLPALRHRKL
jgi:nitrilase